MPSTPKDFLSLLNAVQRTAYFSQLSALIQEGKTTPVRTKTLAGSLRSLIISALWKQNPQRLLILTTKEELEGWSHDLSTLLGEENLAVCTVPETKRKSVVDHHTEALVEVVDAVSVMEKNPNALILATPESFLLHLPAREAITTNLFSLSRNQELSFEGFQQQLMLNGFERQDYVAKPGDVAVRGGIVDVFPIGWSTPLRVEFWGDTIESIREFDPLSQRSIREHVRIEFIARFFQEEGGEFTATLFDHIDTDTLIVFDAPEHLESQFSKIEQEEKYESLLSYRSLWLNPLGSADIETKASIQPQFDSSVDKFYAGLGDYQEQKFNINLCAEGSIHTKRIRELIDNAGERFDAENIDHYHLSLDRIRWETSTLNCGFIWQSERIALFTEHQVFNRQRFRDKAKFASASGITLRELQQLRKGDLIVHVDKGIGQFDGLETITIGGSKQESVRLIFSDGDVLYVHLNYIGKLQRYSAQDGSPPKLSKLGSGEWERKKARTKKKLKDIARDLIKIYALRKSQKGYAYPADTIWQKEFEASFMYEDTPDQARTTAEVKHDMESPTPMDRLVCGDVGFGKTEVAVRAAFKAAQSGKQVAVLVPTTILAQQHYLTFSERLQRYPVKVDVISRFRSAEEQKEIAKGVQNGSVDILIGTHRILSKDIAFKNLGLLIIDEEQRFGVGAKEKLRSMRANVDTLTLTATPIPRTLNFSLMGARDLSVMETPPRNRLPVDTTIIEWSDDTLREAILREIERGGQLYMVNDSIKELDAIAMRLVEILPGLKFGIAHGQMESSKLETVMERFLERKFEVLLSTKIVESGLDIPNVNTIFINHADRFGLAELYQLRGRVGRSNKQAYCYLIVPPVRTLNRTALRRLQAIEEHTDLGSGFHLAMRDLEIRGAGNLLGAEQSGFIAEMGIELYQRILDEAVQELRHEEFSELFAEQQKVMDFSNDDLAIELDSDALLPEWYVKKDTERFEFYKRLYNAQNDAALRQIVSELRDRYGALPPEAEDLVFAVGIRLRTKPLGFERILISQRLMSIELPVDAPQTFYESAFPHIAAAVAECEGRFIQKGKKTLIEIGLSKRDDAMRVAERIASSLHEMNIASKAHTASEPHYQEEYHQQSYSGE